MGRQLRKGENVSDARARWQLERLREEIRNEKEQHKKLERLRELDRLQRKIRDNREQHKELKKPEPKIVPPLAKVVLPPPIDYTPGDRKLSILICSVKGREKLLQNLVGILGEQTTDDVEVLVEVDNKEITIGAKRNILLRRARGDYVAFVDDDDMISNDYISKILKAIETSPDCCAIEGEIDHIKRIREGKHFRRHRCKQKFIHSIRYNKWFERDRVYYRCPNHLNPIRREFAGQIMFPEKNQGEDKDFSTRILPLLKTEVFIEGIIYYYQAVR